MVASSSNRSQVDPPWSPSGCATLRASRLGGSMGCRGVHFSLDEEQVSSLRAVPEDQRVEHVQEEIEGTLWSADPSRGEETDQAWDAIHRALTDGDLTYENGEYPLSHVVLGGEPLYGGEDYVISLKTSAQVRDVAAALKDVT